MEEEEKGQALLVSRFTFESFKGALRTYSSLSCELCGNVDHSSWQTITELRDIASLLMMMSLEGDKS